MEEKFDKFYAEWLECENSKKVGSKNITVVVEVCLVAVTFFTILDLFLS